jgi:hypothetical protein
MGFNLGAFAGGLASAGLKTYTTLKEQERLQTAEEREKERFAEEQRKIQDEKDANEQLRQAAMPGTGGNTLSEIAAALPIGGPARPDIPPEQQALYKELFGRFSPEQQEQMRSQTDSAADKKAYSADKTAYREKFNEVFGGLTEKQQEAVLRGYGNVAIPDGDNATMNVSLGDKGVYTDESGTRRVAALETDEKKILENRKRIAAQSGNPIAIKRAEEAETAFLAREASKQTITKTGYELDKLNREKIYNEQVDKYSTKQVEIMKVLDSVSEAKLDAVPDIVNKELGAFGFRATYAGADGESPAKVQLLDGQGKVVAEYGSSAEVEAAINAQMGAFNASMAQDLIKFLPDAKDRFAALKDITAMAGDKTRLELEKKRVATEEKNVDSQIYSRDEAAMLGKNDLLLRQKQVDQAIKQFEHQSKIDVAKLYLDYENATREDRKLELAETIADTQRDQENQRIGLAASQLSLNRTLGERGMTVQEAKQKTDEKLATLAETRNGWEKSVAEARNAIADKTVQLNRDEFLEAQKLTPGKMRELDAHVQLYNAEAKYRNAAAKELGTRPQDWKVLGTDTDGTPISMDSKSGKFARSDGAPIKDIDFFRKITGVAPDKVTFTAKDLLTFTEAYGDTVVKQKNGKEVKIRDLPPAEQAAQARAFFSGTSAIGSAGLDGGVKPEAGPAAANKTALPADATKSAVTVIDPSARLKGLPVTADTAQAGAAAGTALRENVINTGRAIDTGMDDAGKRFLQGKIARKEPLDAMEKARALRFGLVVP